jgi:hypothetical protein
VSCLSPPPVKASPTTSGASSPPTPAWNPQLAWSCSARGRTSSCTAISTRASTNSIAGCARPKQNPPLLADLLDLNVDASSISYVAGWSKADPSVLTAAASNVLHAVNTIAAGIGLDDDIDLLASW